MDKHEKIITILTAVLLVLIVVIVVLVWGGYSNWFKTDFEYIYLKSGGERLQQSEIYYLGNVKFDVCQFGFKSGYTVKVVVTSNEDFIYTVDDKYYSYLENIAGQDVTAAFNVDYGKKNFVVRAYNVLITDILQSFYPGSEVALISVPKQPALYKLIVADEASKHSFELTFSTVLPVSDIEVNPDHMLF